MLLPNAPELMYNRSGVFLRVRFSPVTLAAADGHLLATSDIPQSEPQRSAPTSELLAARHRSDLHVRSSRARATVDEPQQPPLAMAVSGADSDADAEDVIDECYVQVRSVSVRTRGGEALAGDDNRWSYLKHRVPIARNDSTLVLPVDEPYSSSSSYSPAHSDGTPRRERLLFSLFYRVFPIRRRVTHSPSEFNCICIAVAVAASMHCAYTPQQHRIASHHS